MNLVNENSSILFLMLGKRNKSTKNGQPFSRAEESYLEYIQNTIWAGVRFIVPEKQFHPENYVQLKLTADPKSFPHPKKENGKQQDCGCPGCCGKNLFLQEAIKPGRPLVIIGNPGSGKSTLLRFLAWTFATPPPSESSSISKFIPVLVSLKEWSQDSDEFYNFLYTSGTRNSIQREKWENWKSKELFQKAAKQGRLLLLFDGLDETGSKRKEIIQRLIKIGAELGENNIIVVSSRHSGYQYDLTGWAHFTLAPLREDDIIQFVRWFFNDPLHSEKMIGEFLGDEDLEEEIENPLLLGLLCHFYEKNGFQLPRSRAQLYEYSVQNFIRVDDLQISGIQKPEFLKFCHRVLEKLGADFFLEKTSFSRIEILDTVQSEMKDQHFGMEKENILSLFLTSSNLFMQEESPDDFVFRHQTFQEYYAARSISRRKDITISKLRPFYFHPEFIEVLRFLAGDWGRGNEPEEGRLDTFIRDILAQEVPFREHLHEPEIIAGICMAEADTERIPEDLMTQITPRLLSVWKSCPTSDSAEDVLRIVFRLSSTPFIISFLEQFREIRKSSSDWKFRLAAVTGLGVIGPRNSLALEGLVEAFVEDTAFPVREEAFEMLITWRKVNEVPIEFLWKILMWGDGVYYIDPLELAEGMGQLVPNNRPLQEKLFNVLRSDHPWEVKSTVFDILEEAKLDSEEVIKLAVEVMRKDPVPDNRESAVKFLKEQKPALLSGYFFPILFRFALERDIPTFAQLSLLVNKFNVFSIGLYRKAILMKVRHLDELPLFAHQFRFESLPLPELIPDLKEDYLSYQVDSKNRHALLSFFRKMEVQEEETLETFRASIPFDPDPKTQLEGMATVLKFEKGKHARIEFIRKMLIESPFPIVQFSSLKKLINEGVKEREILDKLIEVYPHLNNSQKESVISLINSNDPGGEYLEFIWEKIKPGNPNKIRRFAFSMLQNRGGQELQKRLEEYCLFSLKNTDELQGDQLPDSIFEYFQYENHAKYNHGIYTLTDFSHKDTCLSFLRGRLYEYFENCLERKENPSFSGRLTLKSNMPQNVDWRGDFD